MAAMVTATSNGEKDWRDECVKPQKDDRIQTLVRKRRNCALLFVFVSIFNDEISINYNQ